MVHLGRIHFLGLALLAASLGMGIPNANAGIIDINSDLTNESNNKSSADVGIPVSPVWAPNGVGYEWISYANTGCNQFDPVTGMCVPGPDNPPGAGGNITLSGGTPAAATAIFYKNFSLPGNVNTGSITIWADDTARVYLDGILVIDANPSAGSNCSGGPIGCLPGMDLTFDVSSYHLGAGNHTLELDAYQFIGGSPFGVMYTGQINSDPVPEPASFLLMGLGLAALGLVRRVKRF